MNEVKVDEIENKLAVVYNECVDTIKLYEEELKTNHVQKKMIEELEGKIQSLEAEIVSLKEQLRETLEVEHAPRHEGEGRNTIEVEAQIGEIPIGVIVPVPMVSMEIGVS